MPPRTAWRMGFGTVHIPEYIQIQGHYSVQTGHLRRLAVLYLHYPGTDMKSSANTLEGWPATFHV